MMNGSELWIIIGIQVLIVVFVLAMLGIIAFSLVRVARYLGEIATELKKRN